MTHFSAPYLFLLSSAPLHALWNLGVKRTPSKTAASALVAFISVVTLAVLSLLLGTLTHVTPEGVPWMIGAGVAEGIYFSALARAYEAGTFGVAYTIMRGGAMLLVWVLSSTLLGEPLTILTVIGVALIFVGIAGANGFTRSAGNMRDAYLAAACIAAYHLCYGQALAHGWDPSPLFAAAMAVGCVLMYLSAGEIIRTETPQLLRDHGLLVLLSGLFCSASFFLFLTGLRQVPPGAAISLRNLSVLFGVLFSYLLREPIAPRQWAGMAAIAVGVLLVGQ